MLYECFWDLLSRDWRNVIYSIREFAKGSACMKRYIARVAVIDPSTLPYDTQIISYIKAWREKGGRTILVTASDQVVANIISDYLGIFDIAHGSNGLINFNGENRGIFLEESFGHKGFVYMANARTDLPVWKRAAKAISVNASKSLCREIETQLECFEHLTTVKKSAKYYLKALRPHQWLKNTLIFLPLLAAHKFNTHALHVSLLAFISFCLVASSVYIVNDLLDLYADRLHPRKKKRPFAAGKIMLSSGTHIGIILIFLGMYTAIIVGWKFFLLMFCYYILTTSYSLYIKRQIVIDIFMLAGLYTLRIVAGGVATETPLSVWMLAFSMFFFFSLAAVKRQAELVDNARRGKLKATGRGYHIDDLPVILMIAIGSGYISVLVLALYLNSPAVIALYTYPQALWVVCTVLLYWITRAIMIAHRGQMHHDPIIYAAKDRVSQLCFLIALTFVLIGSFL